MRTAVYSAALLGALQIAPAPRASAQAPGDATADLPGPVAYTGHGALFDAAGNPITLTAAEILETQRAYIDHLLAQVLGPEVRSAFAQKRSAVLGDRKWSEVDLIYANAALIAWLAGQVQPQGAHRLLSLNTALRTQVALGRLRGRAVGPDGRRPGPSEAMQRALEQGAILTPLRVTEKQGEDYIDECAAAGVPIPPTWGTSGWESRGIQDPLFIPGNAEVFVFEKTSPPRGVCMALPRYAGDMISLLGVICQGNDTRQGNDTSKVCFWDNADVPVGDEVPLAEFEGGTDLIGGDICTNCHAGRNAFLVHPDTAVDLDPTPNPNTWPEPLVPEGWPQNPGPSTELDEVALGEGDGSCLSCHDLPTVSELNVYCSAVLNPAIAETMPPENPKNLDFTKHVKALEAACGVPLPLPEPPGPSVDEMFRIITMPLE